MAISKLGAINLNGMAILITRPARQANTLASRIERAGGEPLCFPVLEIKPPLEKQALREAIESLDNCDWVVFISINAVAFALAEIKAHRSWPTHLKIAVIGKSSALAVEQAGLSVDACPAKQFNSEGLLALPEMQQVSDQRFIIFRGNGGRELLAERLRERGAKVENVEAYRREKPEADTSVINSAGQSGKIDIILINSIESLQNLGQLLGSEQDNWLYNTPLLVVSPRIVDYARDCGYTGIIDVADDATDAAVIQALVESKIPINK